MLLKIAEAGKDTFGSVRMAPLYDAVTRRVFPRLEHDRMALKLNGKDDRLRRVDFEALARTAGIREADADAAIAGVIDGLLAATREFERPDLVTTNPDGAQTAERMLSLLTERLRDFR